MGERGVKTSRFLFHPTDKVFAFGGDARREAQWSVRLPVYVHKQHGYVECFVVEGDTPLLIGRPILSALQVKTDFATNKISVLNHDWQPAVVGERGEYLLQLDDGAAEDPDGEAGVFFDYITDETFNYLQNNQETSSYVTPAGLFDRNWTTSSGESLLPQLCWNIGFQCRRSRGSQS